MKYKGFHLSMKALKSIERVKEAPGYVDPYTHLCWGLPSPGCELGGCLECLFGASNLPSYDYRKSLIKELCKLTGKETNL